MRMDRVVVPVTKASPQRESNFSNRDSGLGCKATETGARS